MSTTYILPPEESGDDLDDFISSLDAAFGSKSKQQEKKKPTWAPPPIIHYWFPDAVELVSTIQCCTCGGTFESVEGVFLLDIHRNGATREKRTSVIPPEYISLPRRNRRIIANITCCPQCFESKIL